MSDSRRLFFGLEVFAPWPSSFPKGRLLKEHHRHLTLAFLGQASFSKMMNSLQAFPPPPFNVGLVGLFDQCLFLPPRHPNVLAWHASWLEDAQPLLDYQKQLTYWLIEQGFSPDHPDRAFLPHVTLCRQPFDKHEWQNSFTPLPFFVKNLCLYESMGHSTYEVRWEHNIQAPFDEIEHTADIAFHVHGDSFMQLYRHAQTCLAFVYPPLLDYFSSSLEAYTIDEIIIDLNSMIAKADSEIGCPFKAISFHDRITVENNLLTWEMIVDV